ncbi:hypothetical protein BH20ACT3_BH20ACT3_00940 [soil metagenome]
MLSGLGVLSDPYARQMLTPSMVAASRIVGHVPHRLFRRSVTLAGSAGSVLWFDATLTAALDDGIGQVATIGAGYDSRASRFARDDVRFFELDHAASQLEKVAAAPCPGPVYVEADLRADSAAAALLTAGVDASEPVIFVVESVTMYLTEDAVRRQFAELAKAAAKGSQLAVNFLPASPPPTAQHRRQLRLQRMARVGSGESSRLGVDPDEAAALVESTGWSVRERTSFRDAARALVPKGTGLPVDAIDERKTLVLGVT